MFPDKANLYICGIEDRQYKEEKIYCELRRFFGWQVVTVLQTALTFQIRTTVTSP